MPRYAKSRRPPYKKRYTKRVGRKVTAYTAAKIAKKVVKSQAPTKEFRVVQSPALNTAALANSFNNDVLTNISQGTADNTRDGRVIYMVGAQIMLNAHNPHTTPRCVRFMVFQDINRAGDLLDTTAWTDLFTQQSKADHTATALYNDISYPLNSNFKIFCDKKFIVSASNAATNAIQRRFWVPIRRKIYYDNLGTASNVPSSGKIYAVCHISELDNTTSSTSSRVSWFARVFFKDA